MAEMKYIGKEIHRLAGHDIVSGRALFTGDLKVTNMAYCRVMHSPHPHAEIINIDTSEAEKVRGVHTVVTYKDVPPECYITNGMSPAKHAKPLDKRVRYIGDAVALVVADTEQIADEAMDLTQEAFVAGFSALDRYDGTRPFRIWISRIALNKCRDWGRRRKVRAFFSRALPLEIAHHVASETPSPDIEVGDRLELARVREAVAALPAKLREVLLLRGLDEISQSEAAAMLDVSEKTIETRLYRARVRLRALLGGASEGAGL